MLNLFKIRSRKAASPPARPAPPDPWKSRVNWRQYLAEPSPFAVTNPSWQFFVNAENVSIRSMLSMGEAAVCFALAKDHWTGKGEIVDLGCLMGLSTYSFASGVAQNSAVSSIKKRRRITCFDLFQSAHFPVEFHRTAQAIDCGSIFDEFLDFLRSFQAYISICPGDVLSLRWLDRPIEIAFVDLAKTFELNAWVVRSIMSNLLPGGYLIQQDFAYEQQWWIPATMERFAEYFETTDYCWGATGLFRLKPDLTDQQLADYRAACRDWPASFDFEQWNDLLLGAERRHHETTRAMLTLSRACMLLHFGRVSAAEKLIDSVQVDGVAIDAYRDFDNIVPSAKDRLRGQIESVRRAA